MFYAQKDQNPSLKALQIYSSRLIDFCLSKTNKTKKRAVFVKGCIPRTISHSRLNLTGPILVGSDMACWLQTLARSVEACNQSGKTGNPAGPLCSTAATGDKKVQTNKQTKMQLISAAGIPFIKESTRFCVLPRPTAVNNFAVWRLVNEKQRTWINPHSKSSEI